MLVNKSAVADAAASDNPGRSSWSVAFGDVVLDNTAVSSLTIFSFNAWTIIGVQHVVGVSLVSQNQVQFSLVC